MDTRFRLKGRKVRLVRPRAADFPLIVRWRNESADCFFDNAPITLESHTKWYWDLVRKPDEEYYLIRTPDEPVGVICLSHTRDTNGCAEYGRFLIAPEHQRKGYGRDALLTLLVHAFYDLNLHRVHGDLLASNEAAIKLNLTLGFRSEGLFRQAVRRGDWYVDVVRMAILSHEFAAIRPMLEEDYTGARIVMDRDGDAGV